MIDIEQILKEKFNNLDKQDLEVNVKNVFIVINNKIKKYENVNMLAEDVINKLKTNTKRKENIKKIERLFFKYNSKFENLDEKLKTDEKLRKEFFLEFEEILKDLPESEKEEILKQTKEHNNKINNLINYKTDNTNLTELFFLDLPLMFLNKATKSLVIINNSTVAELKKQYIKNINNKFKIDLEELTKDELKTDFRDFFKNNNKKEQNNNNNVNNVKIENNKLKKEIEQLKTENKQLKILSNKLIKQADKLQKNIGLLDNFVETELIQTIYTFLNTKDKKQKQKLEKELEQQLKYKPKFNSSLTM